jgi:hypothetical protein
VWDPRLRIKPNEALSHPFITGKESVKPVSMDTKIDEKKMPIKNQQSLDKGSVSKKMSLKYNLNENTVKKVRIVDLTEEKKITKKDNKSKNNLTINSLNDKLFDI